MEYSDQLLSSNLTFHVVDEDSTESQYTFSDLNYLSVEDHGNDILELGLDFTAEHSDFGNMQMITFPILSIESDLLQSGAVTLSTGASAVKLEAIGGDNIAASLDADGDGTYDLTLPSWTWSTLVD